MSLTPDQKLAMAGILNFLSSPVTSKENTAAILSAHAGCGKSYLIYHISEKVLGTHRIVGVAPTHKARKVLSKFLNRNRIIPIKTLTTCSLLCKMRQHSYIGTKNYRQATNDTKMNMYDLFFIDEASMISDSDVEVIIDCALNLRKKVLFIGDSCQIPAPNQKYYIDSETDMATKRISCAFNLPIKFTLTTNMRQASDNPIVELYTEMIHAICHNSEPILPLASKMTDCGSKGYYFYKKLDNWLLKAKKTIRRSTDPSQIRLLAYTNATVRSHNLAIRRLFKRSTAPEIGELLTGYNDVGYPTCVIENSQDYIVKTVSRVSINILNNYYSDVTGLKLVLTDNDYDNTREIFMPDLTGNTKLLKDLIHFACQVNKKGSTKKDFMMYSRLKNLLVFMEPVYKYGENIMSETQLRTEHPLLFTNTTELISVTDGVPRITKNNLVNSIIEKYGSLLEDRMMDDNKPISDNERLCDKFCVIEKDIDYGYCITAHKSQGSSFQTVFIDDSDFNRLKNRWNYRIGCMVNGAKEKTQLRYVCYTRPTDCAYILM